MEHKYSPQQQQRHALLTVFLTVLALIFFSLVLIVISNGLILVVVLLGGGMFLLGMLHYVLCGRAFSEATAGGLDEEQRHSLPATASRPAVRAEGLHLPVASSRPRAESH